MSKIAFVTCADLGRYHVSKKNPLFTHDDQVAIDYLQSQNLEVVPLIWGTEINKILDLGLDLIIIRSPWDYANSQSSINNFFSWLHTLEEHQVPMLNPCHILKWNLNKKYLFDLENINIAIPPSILINEGNYESRIHQALQRWENIVVKPCIGAGAKNLFLLKQEDIDNFLDRFSQLRHCQEFLIQPFIKEVKQQGEWSLIFINNKYSHAVLKKPKINHWLVQDELGGTVKSLEATNEVYEFAADAYQKLTHFLEGSFLKNPFILYARIDIMPGPLLGEIELVEPELFFLDRCSFTPNDEALIKFYEGIKSYLGC